MPYDPTKLRQLVGDLIRQNIAPLDVRDAVHTLLLIETDIEDMRRNLKPPTA
jgi:hypothetical protein